MEYLYLTVPAVPGLVAAFREAIYEANADGDVADVDGHVAVEIANCLPHTWEDLLAAIRTTLRQLAPEHLVHLHVEDDRGVTVQLVGPRLQILDALRDGRDARRAQIETAYRRQMDEALAADDYAVTSGWPTPEPLA